jgi:DNA-binding HxlR family transcriptional regulator
MGKVQPWVKTESETLPKALHEKWNWDIICTINNGTEKQTNFKQTKMFCNFFVLQSKLPELPENLKNLLRKKTIHT